MMITIAGRWGFECGRIQHVEGTRRPVPLWLSLPGTLMRDCGCMTPYVVIDESSLAQAGRHEPQPREVVQGGSGRCSL